MSNKEERAIKARTEKTVFTANASTIIELGRNALVSNPAAYLIGDTYREEMGRQIYLDLYNHGDITAEEAYSWSGLDPQVFASVALNFDRMDKYRRHMFVISALLLNVESGHQGDDYTWRLYGDRAFLWAMAKVIRNLVAEGLEDHANELLDTVKAMGDECFKRNVFAPCDQDMADFVSTYYREHIKKLDNLLEKHGKGGEPDISAFGDDIMEIFGNW